MLNFLCSWCETGTEQLILGMLRSEVRCWLIFRNKRRNRLMKKMMLVVRNMVCMQRCMVVKPKKIRWLPNQSSWLAMIRTSLLLSLLIEFYFFRTGSRIA